MGEPWANLFLTKVEICFVTGLPDSTNGNRGLSVKIEFQIAMKNI